MRFAAQVALPLYDLSRESVNIGRVPYTMKNTYVIPVHKHGSQALVPNYRPVSHMSITCRAPGKLFKNQIVAHRERNRFISPYQFGFVGRRSITCFDP